jgi:hypothetical protein
MSGNDSVALKLGKIHVQEKLYLVGLTKDFIKFQLTDFKLISRLDDKFWDHGYLGMPSFVRCEHADCLGVNERRL